MKPPKRHPLPWRVHPQRPWHVLDADWKLVVVFDAEDLAAYAIATVNALPELVEACEYAETLLTGYGSGDLMSVMDTLRARNLCRAALAALPGEVEESDPATH